MHKNWRSIRCLFLCCWPFLACVNILFAQQIRLLNSGTKSSIRGLSVVSDLVIWASGSNGMVGKSLDAGETWEWQKVKGFEKSDFRDIEAFDAKTAILMAVDAPAFILKTVDGGKTWRPVLADSTKGMFLDAMEFWNRDSGIALGDPIKGRFYIARTFDGGNHWQQIDPEKTPRADPGEACFASSGTNIRKLNRSEACFVSGGLHARIFIREQSIDLPILQGKETTGANSVAIWDNHKKKAGQHLVVVGGDFTNDTSSFKNACLSRDGGKTWSFPVVPPHGYRSCVEYISQNQLICCGLSGVDLSLDGGLNWEWVSKESFHVCRKAKNGKAVYLAGINGKIARWVP